MTFVCCCRLGLLLVILFGWVWFVLLLGALVGLYWACLFFWCTIWWFALLLYLIDCWFCMLWVYWVGVCALCSNLVLLWLLIVGLLVAEFVFGLGE